MSHASANVPSASNIFLVGYRGTGKTTIARLLAEKLGWAWVDADIEIEQRAGMTIREIFAAEGESGFRQRESTVLEELCGGRERVIATGGGIVLREANRQLLKCSGQVVWLTADADTIWRRLKDDQTTAERRPALTVGGLAEIKELLQVREPLYRAVADLIVDTAEREAIQIVEVLLSHFALRPLECRS